MLSISLQELKDVAAVAQAAATVVGVLIAGVWVFYRYWKAAEGRGNIGMECKIEVLDHQSGHYILEVVATVHNRGKVPNRIRSLDLQLQGRSKNDPIEYSHSSERNPEFPKPAVHRFIYWHEMGLQG